ncbi:hypothetical protein C5167_001338 [Papaver somniferum]|uniref:C2H2-type domain-containing protein n=1 Tax=Papaver somniferum TaxID=3469 RepID=A0A4Y7KZ19_PAPSO|nr:zinc finger protein ZAT5-like [Papaver somniferum]RZC77185.1 hypothetical protein C5167_001338 [Papaver somniferum]
MEVANNNQEDQTLMGSNEYLHVVKGKRTKRQRPLSPLTLPAMTTSTSSSGGGGGEDEKPDNNNFPSPTTSVEFSVISSEEEEDMAHCLILLAQGGHKRSKQIDDENGKMARINSRRFYNDAAAATTSKAAGAGAGLYLYECKTCNKCFSSFQALGGHRASHKRPNNKGMCNEETTKTAITKTSSLLMLTEQESPQHHRFNDNSNNNNNIIASSTTCARPSLVLQMGNSSSLSAFNNNKSRVHECSICGSEFSSGQALGGHMRRHRTTNATTATTTTTTSTNIDFSHHQDDQLNFSNKKASARNVLSLDLNLPAPEEDYSSKFSLFSSSKQQLQQQPLVFSASALVDCHY